MLTIFGLRSLPAFVHFDKNLFVSRTLHGIMVMMTMTTMMMMIMASNNANMFANSIGSTQEQSRWSFSTKIELCWHAAKTSHCRVQHLLSRVESGGRSSNDDWLMVEKTHPTTTHVHQPNHTVRWFNQLRPMFKKKLSSAAALARVFTNTIPIPLCCFEFA